MNYSVYKHIRRGGRNLQNRYRIACAKTKNDGTKPFFRIFGRFFELKRNPIKNYDFWAFVLTKKY